MVVAVVVGMIVERTLVVGQRCRRNKDHRRRRRAVVMSLGILHTGQGIVGPMHDRNLPRDGTRLHRCDTRHGHNYHVLQQQQQLLLQSPTSR